MPDAVHDPVHRSRYTFRSEGEDLIVDTWIEPGGGLPAHLHPNQEERWSVVDGRIRIRVGDETRVIGPEDGEMLVRRGTVHALDSVADGTAHLRCIASPALGLQAFLEESAAAARDGLFMKGGIPKSLRGARWAADFVKRNREDVVLSFPPRFVQRAMTALLAR